MPETTTKRIVIYTTPTCPYCLMAKRYFVDRGLPYHDLDVSRDREALKEMVTSTGQYGVPVILVGDKTLVGWDKDEFERLLPEG